MRWYLRYSLSFRDVEELLSERGLEVDHTTIWRWVQRYGPELEERLRRHLKTINRSWRVDETYVRVKGRWCYLYRALDSTGATIDFVLSGRRDAAAATRLFRKALTDPAHPQPRVINTDQARLYGSAIAGMKKEGILRRCCRHRPVQYVKNIVEQDHRAIKRRVKAKQRFREFQAARRTIQGYETMHMIRKGQARWVSGSDIRRQIHFINKLFADEAVDACRAYAELLADAMAGRPRAALLAPRRFDGAPAIARVLAGSWRGRSRDTIHSSGYVVHTLEAAIWSVARTADFRGAVLLAANLADDADTVAAVTGQLAGALYGLTRDGVALGGRGLRGDGEELPTRHRLRASLDAEGTPGSRRRQRCRDAEGRVA